MSRLATGFLMSHAVTVSQFVGLFPTSLRYSLIGGDWIDLHTLWVDVQT